MDVDFYLANTLSADAALRDEAKHTLERLAEENYPDYAKVLCQRLENEGGDDNVRMAAGLALKNSLTSKDVNSKQAQAERWMMVDPNTRAVIKNGLLILLGTPRKPIGSTAGQVVAAIAEIELPSNQWPDLMQSLSDNVTKTNNNCLKQASLKTIGYVCERTDPDVLSKQSDLVLTAVVGGAQKEETDPEVRLAAIEALHNSLEFVSLNFDREGERNYIMQVVCEATQSEVVEIQVAAYQCLVRIIQLYYDKMNHYMAQALSGLTIEGMKNNEETVALQAIEFWSTTCDEELDRAESIEMMENEMMMQNDGSKPIHYHFAQAVLPDIIPVLLMLLTKQEEDVDEDEWTIAMAAATCLSLFAQCVESSIVEHVLPFVAAQIQNPDWRYREASVMAFGSILDGPSPVHLKPLVDQALPTLINMMGDQVVQVRDTAAWTLGRVCELLCDCIRSEELLERLISALTAGLADNTRIVGNSCWAFVNLAENLEPIDEDARAQTSLLSRYMDMVVTSLSHAADRPDNEANSRTSAYEAVSTMVKCMANDCLPLVEKVTLSMLERLDVCLEREQQLVGSDERSENAELICCILGVLTSCIRRVSGDIASVADRIMTKILQLFETMPNHPTAAEDTLLTAGALVTALERDFANYAAHLIPRLYDALQRPADYQLCSISVGTIGDLSRALGRDISPYCPTLMPLLKESLESPVLHGSVKPHILACFGDVAMAIGDLFVPYLNDVMVMLLQAGTLPYNPENYEETEYINTLRESTIEAFVGIIQGLGQPGIANGSLSPDHILAMLQCVELVAKDPLTTDSLARASAGLLGDLAEACRDVAYRDLLKQYLQADWVLQFLTNVRKDRRFEKKTREVARWAKEMIRR